MNFLLHQYLKNNYLNNNILNYLIKLSKIKINYKFKKNNKNIYINYLIINTKK